MNEIKSETERITAQLSGFYNGHSWVTDNLSNRVFSIEPKEALKKTTGHHHSVAQLVAHITAWRNFAVQKLTGNDDYDIEDNSATDWAAAEEWNAVKNDFITCHEKLLNAIESFPADRWHSKVPLRNYTYLFLINGIVQHDYYHYGQIASLLAAVHEAAYAELK